MLLDLTTLIKKHNLKINGVVQVGAHWGEEYETYIANGINNIMFLEPSSKNYEELENRFYDLPNVAMFNIGCSDKEETVQMFVETKNNGQSNSILKPANHTKQYPDIEFNETEQVDLMRLDSIAIYWADYNFLNIDVQCAEMLVLKGAIGILDQIDYIMSEVNYPGAELYEGCTDINEMDKFLSEYGFVRMEEPQWIGGTWSDSFWIKKDKND